MNIESRNRYPQRGQTGPRQFTRFDSRAWLAALPFVLTAVMIGLAPAVIFAQPAPLIHAHAHNDYEHPRPLLDALDHGFCSVEADIYLVDGKLLVAHDRDKVKPARTLESLYLKPLRERVKQHGGRVFPNGPEFTLLIDLKSNWKTTSPVLRAVLTNYADILTTFSNDVKHTNAVMVVISGSRDRNMFAGETLRYATFDGELSDLDTNPSAHFAPWISARWGGTFSWRGTGEMPDEEMAKLRQIVSRAHEQGRRVRFWGAPDTLNFWRTLHAAKVDLINTDNLAGLQSFLTAQ